MSYTQLTQDERYHIQYLSRHCTLTEIAKQLNRHKSTISREIKHHCLQGQQYSAEKAQRQSQTIKQRKRQLYKLDKAEDTARAAVRTLKAHKDRVHTITMDNGKEFYQHTKIAKALKAKTYFCRPYHSWEKGLNENTNGLIRQYFPKQTDFRNISDREIRRIQDELNHRPRKTLGYETPSVLFLNLFQPLIH